MENINILSPHVNNIYVANTVKIFEFFCCLNVAFLVNNYNFLSYLLFRLLNK